MPTDATTALGWVSVRHLQHLLAQGEAAGLPRAELLGAAGLPASALADADGLVPLAALEALIAALPPRFADPLLGQQLAGRVQPPTLGAIGLLFQSCATLRDALETVVRYNGLLSNIGETELGFGPGTVEVRWHCRAGSPVFRRFASEYVLGLLATLARLLVPARQALSLQAVHFPHPPPAAAAKQRAYFEFFGAPVHFDQAVAALVVPTSALGLRLQHGDALLRDILERHAQQLLQQRGQAGAPVTAVRQLIAALLVNGLPAKDSVAAQLGMSGRSLHRHLQAAGTSFQQLLDDVRLELARDKLRASDAPLAVVADALGFSSHQAFLRWFKQHSGQTPGDFRQQEHAS